MQSRKLLAFCAAALALVAGVLLLVAGPGARLGLWHFRTGFTLLRWACLGGFAAAALGLSALAAGGLRSAPAWAGLVLGLLVAWVPLSWFRQTKAVPPIHDITTDPANPPRFAAVLALRKDAPNPPEYGGPPVAREQLRAYPDIRSLVLPSSRDAAFRNAGEAARSLGWRIVAEDAAKGTIEATDTTFWFGFKDDVVIRVVAAADGRSIVDVRSVSREGRSDVGTNARRIRAFLAKLREMP
ncbi:MAG: DUF1499 domain-containing protein [Deltaproteobacteria bacterium]|nr:DUF1499 domain-containing protein [Deltaproteobacteria bacterium]